MVRFGKGDIRGLAAPEAANNASAGGAMVPMLTLGIPGSGTTAILLGALLLFNITPGPLMFQNRPEIAWGLIASMYIGNMALLVINLPLVGFFARLLTIPQKYLTPLIAVLAFIGVYSVVGNPFDLYHDYWSWSVWLAAQEDGVFSCPGYSRGGFGWSV